ncbi:MAG TPA: tetratricopeptide repeat protein, partial [Cyclobacteriaceae bacterium]
MKNILLLIFLTTTAWAQPKTLKDYYDRATEAYKKGNYQQYYEMITGANKIHPYHQGILYEVARAAALVNKPDEAMNFLNRAIHIDADFDMTNPDFKSLVNRDDFKALLKAQKDLKTPVIQSDTAFIVHNRQLHVETIAPGEVPGKFYLSSVHQRKIVSFDKDGNVKDFTTSGQDGLTSVLGLRIDPYRQILWACASPMDEMEQSETPGQSAVYKYDIKTKKLIKKYPLADPEMNCVFGDMCSDQKGGFFISDSKNNIIFRTNERTG